MPTSSSPSLARSPLTSVYNMGGTQCFLCPAQGVPCAECGLVVSCELHMVVHRQGGHCAPFTVVYREGVGHYLVAVRDIKPMELILRETPVVVGPYTQTPAQCLECCAKVSGVYRCSRCNYPMCGQECSQGENHSVECRVFTQAGWTYKVSINRYSFISTNPLYQQIFIYINKSFLSTDIPLY